MLIAYRRADGLSHSLLRLASPASEMRAPKRSRDSKEERPDNNGERTQGIHGWKIRDAELMDGCMHQRGEESVKKTGLTAARRAQEEQIQWKD